MKRYVWLLLFALLPLMTHAQDLAPLGIFDATMDWGLLPDFPPETGNYKAPGRLEVSTDENGNTIYDFYGNGYGSQEFFSAYTERNGSWTLSCKIQWIDTGGNSPFATVMLLIGEDSKDINGLAGGVNIYESQTVIGIIGSIIKSVRGGKVKTNWYHNSTLSSYLKDKQTVFLRLTRYASQHMFVAEWSIDEKNWHIVHQFNLEINDTAHYGIAIQNHADNDQLAHARITNLKIELSQPLAMRLSTSDFFKKLETKKILLRVINPHLTSIPITMTEILPKNWSAENISHGGELTNGEIHWNENVQPGSTLFEYYAIPSNNTVNPVFLSGTINDSNISGQLELFMSDLRVNELLNLYFYFTFSIAFTIAIALLHICLFLFLPQQKTNLYFSLFLFLHCIYLFIDYLSDTRVSVIDVKYLVFLENTALMASRLMLLQYFYSLFYQRRVKLFWFFLGLAILFLTAYYFNRTAYIPSFYTGIVTIECCRIIVLSIFRKIEGIVVIAVGFSIFAFFIIWSAVSLYPIVPPIPSLELVGWSSLLFILSISMHLAYQFAKTQKELTLLNIELEDRVEQRTAELKSAQNQIIQSEKMASLGQLVAGVAHEINNPVNYIKSNITPLKDYLFGYKKSYGFLENHRAKFTDKEWKALEEIVENHDLDFADEDSSKLIASFEEGSNRIARIVEDLRQYSRVDKDYFSLMDLHESIDSTLNLLQSKMKEGITVHKEYGNIPQVKCSPGQIGQVFMNILSNAIDAVGVEGNIWITSKHDKDQIIISIRDDGPGIPKDIQNKIFDPFFTTKPVGSGTGLGLSITHTIIEQHSGSIEVESEAGKGTSLTIQIPVEHK